MGLKEKKLLKQTAIYGIGNLGTKILAYVMVLVYSYYIKSDELGYYDLIITSISLLQPLVLLGIGEATFRFMIDNSIQGRSEIISTSSKFVICSTVIAGFVFVVIARNFHIEYWRWVLLFGVTSIIYIYNQEAIRGYEKTRLYATVGILNSIITLLIEFVGFVFFHGGVIVLLVSKVVANGICIFFMLFETPLFSDLLTGVFDKRIIVSMLKYSIPLVPNSMCWWIMNSSDRYVIRAFVGSSGNGIYAIAYKFPTILMTVSSVFYLAWQESAVTEYNKKTRDIFFSKVYNNYFKVLFSLSSLLIPMTRVIVVLFVASEYDTAWIYSIPLILSAAFSALCSFFGIGYQASRDTVKALYSMIVAAVINIVADVALVRVMGIIGASISTLLAFIVLFFVRLCHSRYYYRIYYDLRNHIILLGLCLISCLVTVLTQNISLLYLYCVVLVVVVFFYNRSFFFKRKIL